jgi:acyl-CoA synthetase (AMP-forming)/AMP-acid ligase II
VPKGLLVHDPGAVGQAVLPQGLCQAAEGDRRDGQVVRQLRAAAERCARLAEHVRQAAGAAGAEPAAGEIGEICFRGRALTSGYLDDAGATAAAFSGG